MTTKEVQTIVRYWISTAEADWKFVRKAFSIRQYSHALFFGHLVLEKTLKALVVAETGKHAPPTHNLLDLALKAGLRVSEEMRRDFSEINTFNISIRYPEERFEIYQRTRKLRYAKKYYQAIDQYYRWLKEEVDQKLKS